MQELIEELISDDKLYIEITGDTKTDLDNLKSVLHSHVIMIGEDHNDDYCRWFIETAMKLFKPDFFLTEHTQYLNVNIGGFEDRLRTLGKDNLPYNKYTKYWLTVGKKYTIPFIGMDYLPPDNKLSTFEKVVYSKSTSLRTSFKIREDQMLATLQKYAIKGKVLLQVGDTHLRTTTSERYFGRASPLIDYSKKQPNIAVFRLSKNYQEWP